MSQAFSIDRFFKLLLGVIVAMCAMFGTQAAFALPCDEAKEVVEVSAEAEKTPCAEPCQGESGQDDDCADDCQFCSCCSMVAPAALASTPAGAGFDVLVYRGDLPLPSSFHHGGVSLRIFKPPRLV